MHTEQKGIRLHTITISQHITTLSVVFPNISKRGAQACLVGVFWTPKSCKLNSQPSGNEPCTEPLGAKNWECRWSHDCHRWFQTPQEYFSQMAADSYFALFWLHLRVEWKTYSMPLGWHFDDDNFANCQPAEDWLRFALPAIIASPVQQANFPLFGVRFSLRNVTWHRLMVDELSRLCGKAKACHVIQLNPQQHLMTFEILKFSETTNCWAGKAVLWLWRY